MATRILPEISQPYVFSKRLAIECCYRASQRGNKRRMTRRCSNCGEEDLRDKAQFCDNCGAKLAVASDYEATLAMPETPADDEATRFMPEADSPTEDGATMFMPEA